MTDDTPTDLRRVEEAITRAVRAYRADDRDGIRAVLDDARELGEDGLLLPGRTLLLIAANYLLGTRLQTVASFRAGDEVAYRDAVNRIPHCEDSMTGWALLAAGELETQPSSAQDLYAAAVDSFSAHDDFRGVAAAQVRLATTLLRSSDYSAAADTAAAARENFSRVKDPSGESYASVLASRALVRNGRIGEARSMLDTARHAGSRVRDGRISVLVGLAGSEVAAAEGHTTEALSLARQAAARARRRGDIDLLSETLQNLADKAIDSGDRRTARTSSQQLLELAEGMRDMPLKAHALRIQARLAVSESDHTSAHALYRAAAEASDAAGRADLAAYSRADEGAALVAQSEAEDNETQASDAMTLLLQVQNQLEMVDDLSTAARVARNLRVAARVAGRSAELAVTAAEKAGQTPDAVYRSALLASAGYATLDARGDRQRALDLLLAAAHAKPTETETLAALRTYADTVSTVYRDDAGSVQLYDALLPLEDELSYADTLNDSGVVAARAYELQDAYARFDRARALAEADGNRVLLAKTLSNLGEVSARMGSTERASEYFTQAAELSEKIGDLASASDSYSSVANAVFAADPDEARRFSARATKLADQSGSVRAQARALSSLATTDYAAGNFLQAYAAWTNAAHLADGEKAAGYYAFALEAVAAAGDWKTYRHDLTNAVARAQREGTQAALAENLWRSALVWTRQGAVQRAARGFAYTILLAFQGYGQSLTQAADRAGNTRTDTQMVFDTAVIAPHLAVPHADLSYRQTVQLFDAVRRLLRGAVEEEVADFLLDRMDEARKAAAKLDGA